MAKKLCARPHPTDRYAAVLQDGEETLTKNAISMNVEKTLTVHLTRLVWQKNVLIPVKEQHVEEEQNAKPNNTELSASAQEDYKEIQSFLVKRLDVHQMTTVQAMKSVTSYLGLVLVKKNVNLYVLAEYVLKEQAVKL